MEQKLNWYINELLEKNSNDAWHGLIEAGERSLDFIIQKYRNINLEEQKKELIDVIKEIKSKKSVTFLEEEIVRENSFELWKCLLEARYYNQTNDMYKFLKKEKKRLLSNKKRKKESAYCSSFLKDLEN